MDTLSHFFIRLPTCVIWSLLENPFDERLKAALTADGSFQRKQWQIQNVAFTARNNILQWKKLQCAFKGVFKVPLNEHCAAPININAKMEVSLSKCQYHTLRAVAIYHFTWNAFFISTFWVALHLTSQFEHQNGSECLSCTLESAVSCRCCRCCRCCHKMLV